ncbi:MAG TPA: family 43 glycosylhydrolase [Fermentimonas caenicola]|jgi:GH43 family beta-xylosidase|uniref:glycoside hydrolase family 43 protein n=1 Tax=Lascolabacillus sp. TaxID=1924068 RepID=UPI00179C4D21|nr:glycoside hydrolase family 43 protein [Lascolabacillus sp.]MBP6175717.1 glycoside hydrolase family 43 protein [Fermentimonas sp.]MDI9625551.1 glycoside hydrolase family 43 protein [Bacteroidota bacterium]HHU41083.1 family 43 glycosylhydrolase [Fermentimonas caenicola]MBP6197010.1 glycoside hydrolase family 43 protein [Fermentimonas sp.]MDD4757709.1 glycoside hydrolase family 43 protein [Lascolabacillus sp.]
MLTRKLFNRIGLALIFSLLLTGCNSASGKKSVSTVYKNPLPVEFGDPFILSASDGKYYMYGTGGTDKGFVAYSSENLADWTLVGQVYDGSEPDSWTLKNYWAPEVYEIDNKYYMFFSADWKVNPTNELENFRIGVAVSDSPAGPFKEVSDKPLFDPGYPIIDANILRHEGRTYLYYSRCCYKHPVKSEVADWARTVGLFNEVEESWVYGVEISNDFTTVIGEPVLLLQPPYEMSNPQTEWESRSVTNGEVNRRWTEGSFAFEHNGKIYMMYSANYFGGEHYAVGYAISDNPLGPFVKAKENPVLEKNISKGGEVTGTGHNMVFRSKDNSKMYCVYHGRTEKTGSERVVFIDEMWIDELGRLIVDGPSTHEKEF